MFSFFTPALIVENFLHEYASVYVHSPCSVNTRQQLLVMGIVVKMLGQLITGPGDQSSMHNRFFLAYKNPGDSTWQKRNQTKFVV